MSKRFIVENIKNFIKEKLSSGHLINVINNFKKTDLPPSGLMCKIMKVIFRR